MTDNEWEFTDAWLMVAAADHGRRGCDLSSLIGSADAYNHAIPTEAEVTRSVGRLVASGLMEADRPLHLRVTTDGRRLAKRARGGMFERAPALLNLLRRWPLHEGQWDLPAGAWQDAYERYRARMAKHM